jgi:hypothetical protein
VLQTDVRALQQMPPVQSAPGQLNEQLSAQHATEAGMALAPIPVIVAAAPLSVTIPTHASAF